MDTFSQNSLRMGTVHLRVADLDATGRFYRETIGLDEIERQEGVAWLGAGTRRLLALHAMPDGRRVHGAPGLYHVAILTPRRGALANALARLARRNPAGLGAADHGVSEALYLADPEGNGIEIYRDRQPEEWPRNARGDLAMVTDPLDFDGLMAAAKPGEEEKLPAGTKVGHVHLQVSHLEQAEDFYTRLLGFDRTQRYGDGAAFLAFDGYHHHLAINTWGTDGAQPAPEDALGLAWYTLEYTQPGMFQAVLDRLAAVGWPVTARPDGVFLHDPAGNGLVICETLTPAP